MTAELIQLVQKLGQPRVLVLGDVMLDRYIWGDAARVSQEAPVLLLRADKREERLGGASSVAMMLRALGARVSLAGIVGADSDGGRVRHILTELGIEHEAVLTDNGRPTTVKERYVGRAQQRHPQQILRVDYEVTTPIDVATERSLAQILAQQIRRADIVLISDYDKGVCTPSLLTSVIVAARARGIRTLADPIRGHDYRKYHGCSAITPNRLEASMATGRALSSFPQITEAATHLLDCLDLEASIITLDKDGMFLAHRDGRRKHLPTRPRQVYDITGAGDMVMSTLALALAAGAEYEPAIALANVAGGLEVEKIGVATVSREEILQDLLHGGARPDSQHKAHTLPSLLHELQLRRGLGQRVAFTNGCFDVLHLGHVEYLQMARAQADVLVVALNSDASVRQLKGDSRPINPLEARLQVLAGLQAVDYVTVFEQQTPLELIRAVRPDVLVKGADYSKETVVGAELVESYGGRVFLAPLRQGYSTSRLVEQMKQAA